MQARLRWRALLLCVCALVLLAACAERSAKFSLLPPEAVILAFGDSLTYGTGADPEASYPAVLENLTKRKVVNAGVPGEVSRDGLARLPALLDEHRPGLLILCHGGNDMLRKLDPGELKESLRSMISMARQRNIPVLLIGVPEPKLALATAPLYAELAEETQVLFEGEILADVLQWPSTKHDMIHPNAAGYRKIAEAIYARLERADLVEVGQRQALKELNQPSST